MRRLLLIAIAACTRTEPGAPTPSVPTTPAPVGPAPTLVDAGTPVVAADAVLAADAAALADATPIKPLALAGPYKTLLESCKAARPCGFTDLDPKTMKEIKPQKTPDCAAVLDPRVDIIGNHPMSMSAKTGSPKMTHTTADGEMRLGGVVCAVPDGIRYDHSEYYVFVKRADGWWRTDAPLISYDHNNKYCTGGSYILWNDKPGRTIMGLAASLGCMTCNKQGSEESITELMIRIELGGKTPIVFQPLPVGSRQQTIADKDAIDCKSNASSTSMKENWVSDDEVILEGKGSAGPLDKLLVMGAGGSLPAAAGRYRFTR